MDIDDDTLLLLSEQRRELTTAITADSDRDFAFHLQMQEAITASLTSSSTASSSTTKPLFPLTEVTDSQPSGMAHLLAAEIDTFNREYNDREVAKNEMRKMHENVNMLLHDQVFAREVMNVPDNEWRNTGDWFEKPYGKGVKSSGEEVFRVYCKGIVSEERVGGIGVAICDTRDSCVFEVKKGVMVDGEDILELKGVIEGLSVAVSLGLRRVRVFCDTNAVYGYLTGKGQPTNNTTATLVDQLNLVQRKFAYCGAYLVRQNDIKFAYKLARDAITSQVTQFAENASGETSHKKRRREALLEQCTICFDSIYSGQMFSVNNCLHKYCFSCMRKHVEAKLLQRHLPECPHEGCKSRLELESCKKFLTPDLYDIMNLEDDKEYIEAIKESSHWAPPDHLRELFVTLLASKELSTPLNVWLETWHLLSEDAEHKRRLILKIPDLVLTDEEKKNVALFFIEELMRSRGSSLKNFEDMPYPNDTFISDFGNRLLYDELDYDPAELQREYVQLHSRLTLEQKGVHDTIMDSVETGNGGVFFVYGYGGTGKTFLWKTLAAGIRRKGDVVLNVASSGIASLLMTGGRTAHSRFKIPINVDEYSTCSINPKSDLAELVRKCKLIIWDEAPMTHKHCFEALDKSLRDILRKSKHDTMDTPFGNMTVVFGGDFRQVLPVIPKGSRQDIVGASLKQSYLWDHCKVLRLTANMRLTVGCRPEDVNEIKDFAEWILKLGDGKLGEENDGEVSIEIPDEILIKDSSDPVRSIIDFTYPNMVNNLDDKNYFTEKAILAPTNEIVDTINDEMLKAIPGEQFTYYSCDSVCKSEKGTSINEDVFSTEFVNGLKFSGVPNHELKLKVGAPIMLLRNIDQSNGLCNGTRLRVDRLMRNCIDATIINGSHFGKRVLIARMKISPSDKRLPLKIVRKQFPVSVSFAMTINKSQGQSLGQVGLYLPRPVFTHGQLYVAVSRVKSKKGLKMVILDQQGNPTNTTTNVVYKEVLRDL